MTRREEAKVYRKLLVFFTAVFCAWFACRTVAFASDGNAWMALFDACVAIIYGFWFVEASS